jgi:hypothetical protein
MLFAGPTDTSAESGAAEAAVTKSALAPTAREIASLFMAFLQKCLCQEANRLASQWFRQSRNFKLESKNKSISTGTFFGRVYLPCVRILGARQLLHTMKSILLATVAILALATPSFAAEPAKTEPPKTVGMASPSFYLAQDTATMKCQIVETQPVAGGTVKVIGAAHATKASAETALKADKACVN